MPTTIDQVFSLLWTQTWQITLLVLLVTFVTWMLAQNRSHLAFVLWAVVFIKCLTPPILCSPVGLFAWDPATTFDRYPMPISVAQSNWDQDELTTAPRDIPTDQQLPNHLASIEISQTQQECDQNDLALGARDLEEPAGISMLAKSRFAFVTIWLSGVGLIFAYAIVHWIVCWLQIRRCGNEGSAELRLAIEKLRKQLKFTRPIRAIVTTSGHGPMVFGMLRPTIILPAVLLENRTVNEIVPTVAHEIIHVRRGDTLMGLLQFVSQTIWWFNPLVWFANTQINRVCEESCDLEVIAELNCNPAVYARSLLNVVELGQSIRPVLATTGIRSADITGIRLRSIMNNKTPMVKSTPAWCWALAIMATLFVLPGTGMAVSQDLQDKEKLTLANEAWDSQDWESAAKHYNDVVFEYPENGTAWFRLGYALHAEGKLDEAIKAHERAADFPQGKPIALYNWACALALQDKTDAAMDKLEESIEAGFASPSPIEEDTDFANVLENDRFKKLAKRARRTVNRKPVAVSPKVYRQLDFWLGEWDVVDEKDKKLGTNSITKQEDGHLIRENWQGADGSTGQSINFFDPVQQSWKQTYIGSNGTVYQLAGSKSSDGVSLKGYTTKKNGMRVMCRMKLVELEDGRIKQVIENSKDDGANWNIAFVGYYIKKDAVE